MISVLQDIAMVAGVWLGLGITFVVGARFGGRRYRERWRRQTT